MRRRTILLAALLTPACGGARSARDGAPAVAAAGAAAGAAALALTRVTVVDVERGSRLAEQTVLIEGGRIRAVGPTAAVRPPAGARVVDAAGKYVIPGLWDMHVHTVSRDVDFPLHLAHGVTGVRDMGGTTRYPPPGAWGIHFDSLRVWRVEIRAGRVLGPRIVAGGAALDGPTPVSPLALAVPTAAAGRRAVDSLRREGVDFIKVYTRLPRDVFLAIADEARRAGLPVAGHLSEHVDPEDAAAAGQRSLEHILFERFYYDTTLQPARLAPPRGQALSAAERAIQVERYLASFDTVPLLRIGEALARRGTWFDPTVVWFRAAYGAAHGYQDTSQAARARLAYVPSHVSAEWQLGVAPALAARPAAAATTRRHRELRYRHFLTAARVMRRAGVKILAGSDPWNPYLIPGFSLHDELELLVAELGLTPLEALRAATLEPARYFGAADSLGSVAPGRVGDLVVLDADPLADIRNARRIHAVVTAGRLLDRAALDRLLASARAAARDAQPARPGASGSRPAG